MQNINCLQRGWREALSRHIQRASRDILIASPYVTREGTALIADSFGKAFKNRGRITIVTDLSPLNVVQGATDPVAFEYLATRFPNLTLWHLPRLHAKVYVVDSSSAIVSSGNLTRGGLDLNYEYGLQINDSAIAAQVRQDVLRYGELGAQIGLAELARYRRTAETVREAFRHQQLSVNSRARIEFEKLFHEAENELIGFRISGGSRTSVFEKTVEYILDRYGPLSTPQIHVRVQAIHPDLCDDTVDRVIAGEHFGREWKHSVRTAQAHLKEAGRIELAGGRWMTRHVGPRRTQQT